LPGTPTGGFTKMKMFFLIISDLKQN